MPIFKSIITGLATQIMNQGVKKFQSQSGFTFSSPNSTFSPRPTSNGGGTIPLVTAPSVGKYTTNRYQFPLDLVDEPGLGNFGHYMMFYINQQQGAQLEFGQATGKNGQTSVMEDAKQRSIPKNIRQLAPDGVSFTSKENTDGVNTGQLEIGPSNAQLFRMNEARQAGVEYSGGSTGLYLKRNPTVRLDTAITLYMPASVSTSYAADYHDPEIGPGAAIAARAYDAYVNRGVGARQIFDDNETAAFNALKDGLAKAFLASVDVLPGFAGAKGTYEAQTGVVLTDRLELLFKGLGRRTFSFTFAMMPKSEQEAQAIRNIVYAFKYNMLPEFEGGNRAGRKLRVPNTFDIEYMYHGKANDYLNKISTCVLKTMDVKYGGDRYKTFDPDSLGSPPPVMTEISLTFEEMELITRERIAEGY